MLEAKLIPGFTCYYIDKEANIYSTKGGKIKKLKPCPNYSGYMLVTLDGKSYRLHRLIAKTYLNLFDDSLVVNHLDFNKANNKLDNLEVITYKENSIHARLAGRYNKPSGEKNGMAKHTDEFILKIRRMCELGLHDKEVGDILALSSKDVNRIRLRRRWAHI